MAPRRVAAAKAAKPTNTRSPINKSTSSKARLPRTSTNTIDERAKARHARQAATKAATEAKAAEEAKAAARAADIAEKKRIDRVKSGEKRKAALKTAAAKNSTTTTTSTKRKAASTEDAPARKRKNTTGKSPFQYVTL